MMTMPMFVAFQRLAPRGGKFLSSLASLTFGIYLCHFFFVMVAYDLFDIPGLPYAVRIVAMAVCVFSAAALLTWVLRRFRLTSPLVS